MTQRNRLSHQTSIQPQELGLRKLGIEPGGNQSAVGFCKTLLGSAEFNEGGYTTLEAFERNKYVFLCEPDGFFLNQQNSLGIVIIHVCVLQPDVDIGL